MRWKTVIVAILVAAEFTCIGCGRAGARPGHERGFSVSNDSTSCSEGYASALVSFEQAAKSLPKGYVAKDAGAFFGGAPTGKALFTVGSDVCRTNAIEARRGEADVLIYIAPPRIAGVPTTPGALDYYVPYYTTTSARLADLVRRAGVRVERTSIDASVRTAVAGAGTGHGETRGGFSYDLSALVPPSTPEELDVFWFQTSRGVLEMEFHVDHPLWFGSGSCTIISAVVARLAGFTKCPADAMGFAQTGGGWRGTVAFYPGKRAR